MTASEARTLTDEIKAATERLWSLLLRAYEGRAWVALGYESWRAWATTEFDVSERRAYYMLDEARIGTALAEASGADCTMVQITERDAQAIKPRLGEALEDAREFVADGMAPGEAVDRVVEKYGRIPKAMVTSASQEWYSPPEIVALAAEVLGGIDLDPCSNSRETPNVAARQHFTRDDDGLSHEWRGSVYMNPPYGGEIGAWVLKLSEEYAAGRTSEAIALVPARMDTQWWQTVRDYPVCVITGRLKFVGAENSAVQASPAGAPFVSAVLYLGDDVDRFVEVFEQVGTVYRRVQRRDARQPHQLLAMPDAGAGD